MAYFDIWKIITHIFLFQKIYLVLLISISCIVMYFHYLKSHAILSLKSKIIWSNKEINNPEVLWVFSIYCNLLSCLVWLYKTLYFCFFILYFHCYCEHARMWHRRRQNLALTFLQSLGSNILPSLVYTGVSQTWLFIKIIRHAFKIPLYLVPLPWSSDLISLVWVWSISIFLKLPCNV